MRNYACPVKTDIYRAFLKIWASFCGTIYIVLYDCSTPVLEQSVITHIWLCCGMQKDEKALVIGGKVEAACQMFMMKLKSCRVQEMQWLVLFYVVVVHVFAKLILWLTWLQ